MTHQASTAASFAPLPAPAAGKLRSPADRAGWVVVVCLAVGVGVLGVALANPEIAGFYHDDGIYALTAKAIAQGEGYRLINLPSAPAATKYPPLYPALLSLVWLASPEFPANLPLLKAVNAVLLALLLPVVYAWTGRLERLSVMERLFICALVGTSPGLFWFSDILLSEPLFILLTACLFVIVESREKWTARRAVLAGVIGGLAVLTRVPAVALAAAVAFVLLRSGRRSLLLYLGGVLVIAVPWWTWRVIVAADVGLLESYYVAYEPSAWTRIFSDSGFVLRVAKSNALFFKRAIPLVFGLPLTALVAVGVGLAAYGAWRLRRSNSFLLAAAWLGLTALPLLGHPYPMARYLTPFVFVMYALVIAGASSLGAHFLSTSTTDRLWLRAIPAVVALSLLMVNTAWLRHYNSVVGSSVHGEFGRALPFQWASFSQTVRWLRENTPPHATLASGHDTFYALNTGRLAVRPWIHRPEVYTPAYGARSIPPDEARLLADLERLGVRYFVLDPLLDDGEAEWGRATVTRILDRTALRRLEFMTRSGDHEVWSTAW